MTGRPRITPSPSQALRRMGKEKEPGVPCPLLHEYETVLHGQRVTVRRYGRPAYDATPLRKDLVKRVPEVRDSFDPEWIK
jgi:hypothetical protein